MVFEITTRTVQERYLLRPSPVTRDLIVGVLAKAKALYDGVNIHAFVFLSNHYHLLISVTDGKDLSDFLCYVNGNVARELGREHRWRRCAFWSKRATTIVVLDEAAQHDRMKYVLSNGVKEGLVRSPRDWPGASSVGAQLGSMTLVGKWIDRDSLRRARLRDRRVRSEDHTTCPELELTPLPAWKHLSKQELLAKHETLVAEIETTFATHRVLGVKRVLALNPHSSPTDSELRRIARGRKAPVCHTTFPKLRDGFRRAYRAFVDIFRNVSLKDEGAPITLAEYPEGSFPRPSWFRTAHASAFEELLVGLAF